MRSGEKMDERRVKMGRPGFDPDEWHDMYGYYDNRQATLDALSVMHVSIIASLYPELAHATVTRTNTLEDLQDELNARTQRLEWETESRLKAREKRVETRRRRKRSELEGAGLLTKPWEPRHA